MAEKALKGGVYALCGMDAAGLKDHDLTRHARAIQTVRPCNITLACNYSLLNNYYVDTRYPNRWSTGAPYEHYTPQSVVSAKEHAEAILEIMWTFFLTSSIVSNSVCMIVIWCD